MASVLLCLDAIKQYIQKQSEESRKEENRSTSLLEDQ